MTPEYTEVRFDLRDIVRTGRFPDRRRSMHDALMHLYKAVRG